MRTADLFAELIDALEQAALVVYGDRLVSLVVFGSVGRGSARPDSDLDVLLVVDPLPRGRMARVAEFGAVEDALESTLRSLRKRGLSTEISPVFKTRDEASRGSPLVLDMVEDARLVLDRDAFFAGTLDRLRARMRELGSRRVWRGARWYWDLKPDFEPGEVIEL
jgi:hypothetical protein